MFEPVRGSVPVLAGRVIANPVGQIAMRFGALKLERFARRCLASAPSRAARHRSGSRARDIGGTATTHDGSRQGSAL